MRYDDSRGTDFRWATALGQTNHVWIVDLDGTSLWLEAETYKGARQDLVAEVQGIIEWPDGGRRCSP